MPKKIILNHVDKVKSVSYAQTKDLLSLTRPDTVEFMSGELKEVAHQPTYVVYVGSTCRDK